MMHCPLAWQKNAGDSDDVPPGIPAGAFGWLAPSHWIGDIVAGGLSTMLGSVGYVVALKYFDPLVR